MFSKERGKKSQPVKVMKTRTLLLAAALCGSVHAETVKDREASVRQDKATMEKDARWLYNDTDAGFAAAKKAGKPLLVVLRCVPCLSCMGLDAQVIEDAALAPLLDQFVCLRVINANALDLARFQFDYDLSLTAMIFHADGTVLGRFGSWQHQKNKDDRATDGFRAALNAALALHKSYPAIKASLSGKQGAPIAFKSPVEIPSLSGKYTRDLNWQGKVVQSCVHCHMIGDALRTVAREQKKPMPDELIWPFPAPETIGLTLSQEHAARVTAVAAGSPADQGGLKPGDDIAALDGQPLISSADLSWVLHRAPATGKLTAAVKRGGIAATLPLALPAGWRSQSDISRRVGTWDMRGMATGGLVLEDVPDVERGTLNVKDDQLALRVKHVGQYGTHAAAKHAGWQQNDVLVEINGLTNRMSEGALIGHLLQKHQAGEKLKATVLRGGKRVNLTLPMQ
jgi:serine protease Do